MPELNQTGTTDTPVSDEKDNNAFSQIGQFTAFDWSPEPHYMAEGVYIPEEFESIDKRDTSPLSENARNALMELDMTAESVDVAPRRIEIEQTWRANHYDRGYQFLLKNPKGGWVLPGATSGVGAKTQQNICSLYHTNIYGEKGEIITAAMSREVPKVEFSPADPDHAPDQDMSDVSDDLKDIWAKNNGGLQPLLQDAAKIFWNDGRCLFWTRFELNGEEYGYQEDEQPTVPENEQEPPTEPTDTEGGIEYQIANESPVDKNSQRRPRGRVKTSAFGKLAQRVPINCACQADMGSLALYEDKDIAIAKAQFPWMREKVKGGGDGTGETELDRVARENVNQAVPGQYVTGDSINRHCVVKHRWFRRSMFFDEKVQDDVREELLAKFPDGALLVKAGSEFAFARNEGVDDAVVIGHPFPGKGQNRRALGESLLPIQDYINELVMLALDFAKRTVPKKWMDADAFNVEAVRNQRNVPGDIGPFASQPGKSVDQLIFIEPTPTPQPWMISWIQWIITSLSEQISGALPSLFGASITGQVGSEGVAIQRDQALQRVGCPWNSLQAMFAAAARQAVMLTAKCANTDIRDVIPGRGPVSIRLNDLKGNVLCYPEANPEFPESWAQRESRLKELLDFALKSPDSAAGAMLLDPKNLKEFKTGLRLHNFTIKGASSVDKQEAELEILLRSGPMPNPQKAKLQAALNNAVMGMKQEMQAGTANPQELQQAPAMLNQLEQTMNSLPDQVSTVPVRDDGSQDNVVEAGVLFDWMNGANGRKYANGNAEQKAAFENVLLHWTEETTAAKKVAAANAPPPQPPRVSFNVPVDKLPAPEAAAAVQAGGIQSNPADFQQHQATETNSKIAQKVVPDQLYLQGIHKEPSVQ